MRDEEERVILVDERDVAVGECPKLEAHHSGLLHRAFSVFVVGRDGRVLLQRRAAEKYHSPGLWSNSCCGHPRPGEETAAAARRRLREEMGIDCELTPLGAFEYRAPLEGGLVEHELDHVFAGRSDAVPAPDASEVWEWRWASLEEIRELLQHEPGRFTAWFAAALDHLDHADPVGRDRRP